MTYIKALCSVADRILEMIFEGQFTEPLSERLPRRHRAWYCCGIPASLRH